MLTKLTNMWADSPPAEVRAPSDLMRAMRAADRTQQPSGNVQRFPLDALAQAAARANNRVVDCECQLSKAEIHRDRVHQEADGEVEHAAATLGAAKADLENAQRVLMRGLIEAGALERVSDFTVLVRACETAPHDE